MILTNVVWALLLFFVQPLFLIAVIYTLWNRHNRVSYVRKTYRMNFNRSYFEVADFFLKAFIPGLLVSALILVLGIPLTIEWYLIYQVLTIFLLLISGSRFIHPLFTFSLSAIALFILDYFKQSLPLARLEPLNRESLFSLSFTPPDFSALFLNIMLVAVLILFFTNFLLNDKDLNKLFPMLRSSKRGKTVAKYQNKTLWLMPLAVIVPGEVVEPFAAWWPFFNIGGERFAILLLPILIGFHYTVSTQLLQEASLRLKQELQLLLGVLILALGVAYFYSQFSILVAVVALIGGIYVLYRHRRRENLWAFRYGPADEGLRVISIRPDSPAERLNLSIGDIITDINDYKMDSHDDFYEVLTYNRSYIKMRIRRNDGEIVIADTPLYDDDVNNLGLLVL